MHKFPCPNTYGPLASRRLSWRRLAGTGGWVERALCDSPSRRDGGVPSDLDDRSTAPPALRAP
jgi:hypothetical protein